jgi:hypothetical protein
MVALAIVLLIAALRYGWSLLGFEGIPVAAQRAIPRREVPPSRAPADQLAVLRMADLDRVPGISAPGRDPWSFVDPPQKTATSRRSLPVLEVPPVAPASPVVRENPYPEFTLHYLGRFGPPEKQIAVFSDGGRVFNRLEGSVIDRRFVVERIGYESVDIRYVDFPDAPAKRIGVSPHR